MGKGTRRFRQIELEYSFDRLSEEKIILAYRFLVPEKMWETGYRAGALGEQVEDAVNEAGGDLCASIVGSAKRGTYDR